MKSPIISIIVPVFNVEKYLSKCIDSILAQTFTDWELLLIDDGSPDQSGEICDEYAKVDSRIRVFHKTNGGVSSSRNLGIDNANGTWVCFIDSDDWITEQYLHTLIKDLTNEDFSMQGYKIVRGNNSEIHTFDMIQTTVNVANVFCEAEQKNIINSPISKLFKRSIIVDRNIRFNNAISYGEDHLFVLDYMKYVTCIHTNNTFNYIYYQDETPSLTRKSIASASLIKYIIQAQAKQFNLINNFTKEEQVYCKHIIAWRFYGVQIKLFQDFFSSRHNFKQYKQMIKDLIPYRMSKISLKLKRKILFCIIEELPPSLSYYILRFIV